MKLSFDDEHSFKEAVESICFNDPPSDPNTHQRMESMLPQDSERNEDIGFNNSPSDPNSIVLRRVESSTNSSAIVQVER